MKTGKPSLYNLSVPDLEHLLKGWGEPAFRAKQVYRQLYVNLVGSPEQMTDLPAPLRKRLGEETVMGSLALEKVITGDHGMTRKALFRLPDGSPVESVLMVYMDATLRSSDDASRPAKHLAEQRGTSLRSTSRATVCVSSQSGCPMACVFCATGKLGFLHDLTPGQIVEQVMWAARELRDLKSPISNLSNVVFMGMGEPFNNYANWWTAVERLHDPKGYNMGARSFTVSTVGLVPGIRKLAAEKLQVNLAISLHAPDDELRTGMMPVNKRYPIAELMDAVRDYTEATHRRVSFEYVLLKEKNDFPAQAEQLGKLLRGAPGTKSILCHVNLIPWNPVPGTPLGRSDRKRVLEFQAVLEKFRVPCTVRVERGVNIGAACGQLAGESEKK